MFKINRKRKNSKCSKTGKSRDKHMPHKQKNLMLDIKTHSFSLDDLHTNYLQKSKYQGKNMHIKFNIQIYTLGKVTATTSLLKWNTVAI